MSNQLLEKVLKGVRLSKGENLRLFQLDLLSLANIANKIKQRKHPHDVITYIID